MDRVQLKIVKACVMCLHLLVVVLCFYASQTIMYSSSDVLVEIEMNTEVIFIPGDLSQQQKST